MSNSNSQPTEDGVLDFTIFAIKMFVVMALATAILGYIVYPFYLGVQ